MNKLLIGLLGAAGLFLVVALVLYFSAPKPPAPEKSEARPKADVIEDIDSGPLRPKYDSPEALIADYKKAMDYAASTETVNAALTDYYLCRAYRAASPEPCGQIDALNPTHMRFEKCLPRYHKGMMLKNLVTGSQDVASCVWVMKYRFEGEPSDGDHDETPLIEKNCRESVPYWVKGGDYDGLCRTEAGILALDDDPPQEVAARCKRSNRSYFGDPAKCEGGYSGYHVYCPENALLVKALRTKDASPLKGTAQAPLAESGADCRALAAKVLSEYEEVSKTFVSTRMDALRVRRFEEKEKQRGEKETTQQELEAREKAKEEDEAARAAEAKRKEEDERNIREAAEAAKRETAEKYEKARLADEQKRIKQGKPMKETKEPARESPPPPPPSRNSGG